MRICQKDSPIQELTRVKETTRCGTKKEMRSKGGLEKEILEHDSTVSLVN